MRSKASSSAPRSAGSAGRGLLYLLGRDPQAVGHVDPVEGGGGPDHGGVPSARTSLRMAATALWTPAPERPGAAGRRRKAAACRGGPGREGHGDTRLPGCSGGPFRRRRLRRLGQTQVAWATASMKVATTCCTPISLRPIPMCSCCPSRAPCRSRAERRSPRPPRRRAPPRRAPGSRRGWPRRGRGVAIQPWRRMQRPGWRAVAVYLAVVVVATVAAVAAVDAGGCRGSRRPRAHGEGQVREVPVDEHHVGQRIADVGVVAGGVDPRRCETEAVVDPVAVIGGGVGHRVLPHELFLCT